MTRFLFLVLGLFLSLGVAHTADAMTLFLDWDLQGGMVSAKVGDSTYGATVGSFLGHEGGPAGPSLGKLYCAELGATAAINLTTDYEILTTNHPDLNHTPMPDGMNRGNGPVAAWIFEHYGAGAATGAEAGAAQVAIWESLYDVDMNLDSGNFRLVSWGMGFDKTRSQNILNTAAGQAGMAAYFRSLSGRQDLIGATPVPEPQSLLLLGLGLVGTAVGLRARRRS